MKSIMMFLFMFLGINFTLTAQNSMLKIEVSGFEEITGKLSIGLFNDPDNFPKKNESNLGVQLDIKDSVLTYLFSGLEPGVYALAVYHDENGNGELDANFLGIPSEDYVFSNYATGTFGPPSFEDAKFELTDSLHIKLELNK